MTDCQLTDETHATLSAIVQYCIIYSCDLVRQWAVSHFTVLQIQRTLQDNNIKRRSILGSRRMQPAGRNLPTPDFFTGVFYTKKKLKQRSEVKNQVKM